MFETIAHDQEQEVLRTAQRAEVERLERAKQAAHEREQVRVCVRFRCALLQTGDGV